MKKNLLEPSLEVRMAMDAINRRNSGIRLGIIVSVDCFFKKFMATLARPGGPSAMVTEISGLLHEIPRLFELTWKEADRLRIEAVKTRTDSHKYESLAEKEDTSEADRTAYRLNQASCATRAKGLTELSSEIWEHAVNLFDFLERMAEFSEHRLMQTSLKEYVQPKATNILHGMIKAMYQPGTPSAYPFAHGGIATIVMRYIGSPYLSFPERKQSNYTLFHHVVRDLIEFWGIWFDHPEFHPYILRALHRTDQLSVLSAPKYDDIIPAFIRYAEEEDGKRPGQIYVSGMYGDFDPENLLEFLKTHGNLMHSGRMISNVLHLIVLCNAERLVKEVERLAKEVQMKIWI
jgi:hypothetical protein